MNQSKSEYLKNLKGKISRFEFLIKTTPKLQLKTNCVFTLFEKQYDIRKMNQIQLRVILKMLDLLDQTGMPLGNFTVKSFAYDILSLLDTYKLKFYQKELKRLNEEYQKALQQNKMNENDKLNRRDLSNLLGF